VSAAYDEIGTVYARHRQPDPRIAAQIRAALGDARTVVNVGAGTGSYEFDDLDFVAVELSDVMLKQRAPGSAPAVQATAVQLPFPSMSFDAALASLTVHHWPDKVAGLREMCRVAERRVVFGFEVGLEQDYWLGREYLPEVTDLDYGTNLTPEQIAEAIGADRIEVVPVPHDCQDGFFCAYWRRPERYLDPTVRACISCLARLDDAVVERGMARLRDDLASGAWEERHADLLDNEELDLGYRLIIAD
jgi:SAM-dependent methyltransferase